VCEPRERVAKLYILRPCSADSASIAKPSRLKVLMANCRAVIANWHTRPGANAADWPEPEGVVITAPKILGLTLMLSWPVMAIFNLGAIELRPVFLFSGALVCWLAMRSSKP
jgi:hypothetical protein